MAIDNRFDVCSGLKLEAYRYAGWSVGFFITCCLCVHSAVLLKHQESRLIL